MSAPRDGVGRLLALAALCLMAVALFGVWTFRAFVAEPAPPAPPPRPHVAAPAPDAQPTLVVTALEGTVERGSGSTWQPVQLGEVVPPEQSLRTAPRGQAELAVGGSGARLVVPERSELRVGELSRAAHRFRLTRGRVQVDYQPEGGRVVRIESANGAVAQATGARFWMLASGTVVAVAAERGLVNLSAAGTEVQVRAGEQAVALAGQAPGAPTAIPAEVLLAVARTSQRPGACAVVEGKVHPGSELSVNGEPLLVSEGSFRLTLPRRPGARDALLAVREPSGAVREQRIACLDEAPPPDDPKASVHIDWSE